MTRLSSTDSTLPAHLDEDQPVRATALAKHLGLAASTLSAAIARLAALGYVTQRRHVGDGRAIELFLSDKGARAMQASSVLDPARVKKMLARLPATDRKQALTGLAILAQAARGEA